MADSRTPDPSMASSGTGGVEESTEVVPPVVGTTVGDVAVADATVGETHGTGEAVAGVEEAQTTTTAAGGAREEVVDPMPAQNPTGTSDPERVSEIATILSTASDLHTIDDVPASSSALPVVDDVVLAAVGGSGGHDVGGSDTGGGDDLVLSGGIAEGSLVSGGDVGGGVVGGLSSLVGGDATGGGSGGTGHGGGGTGGAEGGVGGADGVVDGSGPSDPIGDSGVGTSRPDKGKGIAMETADAPSATEETVSEVLREVEAEERERERGPGVSVVEVARRALLGRPIFHADTYDAPVHHIIPSAIDRYTSLQERYDGEEVLLDPGRHLSRDCLEV